MLGLYSILATVSDDLLSYIINDECIGTYMLSVLSWFACVGELK